MRKVRIVALLILCALLPLVFVGCVDDVSVTQYLDGNGSLHRNIVVTYDLKASDATDLRVEIKEVMARYIDAHNLTKYATISEEKEGEIHLNLLFPSTTEYNIWMGYTGREESEELIPSKKGIVNAYDRRINSYLTEQTVADIRSLVSEEYRDFPLTASFYYTYGTTNRSTISNGERSEKDGVYYHTWKIDLEHPSEMNIRIYGLNVTAIYLIAISIFVLSLATIFVIIYINKRKQKKIAEFPHDSPRLSEPVVPIGSDASTTGDASSENEDDKE